MEVLMRTPTLVLLALTLLAVSAGANYTVRIETDDCVCLGTDLTAYITIEPDDPGNEILIGGFDLTVSYDADIMSFLGGYAGTFLSDCAPGCSQDCGWEYFTYRTGSTYSGCCYSCANVGTTNFVAIADMIGGATPDSSCFEPLEKSTLVRMPFHVTPNNGYDGEFSYFNFYWRPDSGPCSENTFSNKSGTALLFASSVVDADGNTFDTSYYCSGPPSSCDTGSLLSALDFHGGKVLLGANERGDLNLNGFSYEISDVAKYSDCFICGWDCFFYPDSADSARQVANSEINCDGLVLTISDLVYLIRVITGDATPVDSCPPCPRCTEPVSGRTTTLNLAASVQDTLRVRDRSAEPGEERVPFYIHVANATTIAGIQARMVFDTAHLTPHFDTAVGDGESVEFSLMSRTWNYETHGQVKVKSYEPGVILITFLPDLDTLPSINAGSGNILTVRMDVKSTAMPFSTSDVEFVTEGYYYNIFSDMYGFAVWPELVTGEFEVEGNILPPPSCPVLYSYDGADFVQNDPLLTACEVSGYRDVVTDYYHLPTAVSAEGGRVRFQLREMEDEVTFLDGLELMTVDHAATTRVAAGADGQVVTYQGEMAPISAVDNDGRDCLAEVVTMDGRLYSSDRPGYLTVTFPNTGAAVKGYNLPNALKSKNCLLKASPDGLPPEDSGRVTVEILDNGGVWRELPPPPMRQSARQAAVLSSLAGRIDGEFVTIRISWDGRYTIDAVSQFVAAEETPTVTTWPVAESELHTSNATPATGARSVLTKGDVLDFSFDTDQPANTNAVRDYIVKAVGRYQPDYSARAGTAPNDFRLYDNYPNPFNPATTIAFDLPVATHVNLTIINALGQTVETLVDQDMGPGHQEVQWVSSSDHASGVYFYRLKTDSFEQTRKMVLMK